MYKQLTKLTKPWLPAGVLTMIIVIPMYDIYIVKWSLGNKKLRFLMISWSTKKRKLDISITKPSRDQFEAAFFNQERLLYCT